MNQNASKLQQIRREFHSKSIVKQISVENTNSIDYFKPHHFEIRNNCIVIWLNENTDNTNEIKTATIGKLQKINESIKIFTDRNQCIDHLTDCDGDEKVYMIISQVIDRQFIQLIEPILQLQYIYILKEENKNEIFPIRPKGKVKGVFTSMESILDRLRIDTLRLATDRISFSIISSTTISSNQNELNQSFMYSQLMKEIILDIEFDDNSIKQFVDFCLDLYEGNDKKCESLRKFKIEYKTHSPLWWYSKETFIYSLLNEALRTQNTKIIIKMAFYLRDLLDEIDQKHAETKHLSKLIVYRGQGMLDSEFENMKQNKGSLISFNNFLSTTTDRNVAQMFAESSQQDFDMIAVLFQMKIDSSIPDVSYVHLKENGNFQDEDEVLFSMNTVFRIDEVNQIKDRLWQIDLIANDNNDLELQNLTEYIRNGINLLPGWFSMAVLLQTMGRYDEAMEIFNLSNEIKFDEDLEMSQYWQSCRNGISCESYLATGNLSTALIQTENILDKCQQIYAFNHPIFILIYINLATCHMYCSNYRCGLFFAEKALELSLFLQSNLNIMIIHQTIGQCHCYMGNYSMAFIFFKKAHENAKNSLPPNHPNSAVICFWLGESFRQIADYPSALKYLEQARTMGQKSLPVDHPIIIQIMNTIGLSHLSLGSISSALSIFEEALDICERSATFKFEYLALCYGNIGRIYHMKNNYSLALSCYEKCLTILQDYLPENHPNLSWHYSNIGLIYNGMGLATSALNNIEKAINILQLTFPSDHLYLSYCYVNIGEVYRSLGKYSEALFYLEKGLEIQKKSLTNNHPDLIGTYEIIYYTKCLQGNHIQMISDCEKPVQIHFKNASDNELLFSDGATLTETSKQLNAYITAGFSQLKAGMTLNDALIVKYLEDGLTDSDIRQAELAHTNFIDACSNIEQALKIRLQSCTSDKPTLNICNGSLQDQTEKFEHYLNMISSLKKAGTNLSSLARNNREMIRYNKNKSHDEQIADNDMMEALSHLEKGLEIEQKQRSPHDPFRTVIFNHLTEYALNMSFYTDALCYCEKALAAMPSALPINHPLYAKIYNNMAKALDGLERYQEALDYAQRAVDVAHSSFDCSSDETNAYEDQLRQIWRKAPR